MSIPLLNAVAWLVLAMLALGAAIRVWNPRVKDTEEDLATAGAVAIILGSLCGLRLMVGVWQ